MSPQEKDRQVRIAHEKIKRARELMAYADAVKVEIGFEGEYTTFNPASAVPQRFIEEATLLSPYIRAIKEGRIK